MVTVYKNIPCVISHKGELHKVERPKKFFNRHREMNDGEVIFHYIDENITGMKEIAQALQKIEDSIKGITRIPKDTSAELDWKYKYRLNVNTVLCAGNLEDFNKLKKWYNVE